MVNKTSNSVLENKKLLVEPQSIELMRICVCGGQGSAYVFPVLSRTMVGFFLKRFFSLRFLCVAVDSMEPTLLPWTKSYSIRVFLPFSHGQNARTTKIRTNVRPSVIWYLLAPTFPTPQLAADCCVIDHCTELFEEIISRCQMGPLNGVI